MALAWYTASTATTEMNVKVTQKGLDAAREQCLRFKGLALDTETPPSESFAQGVVLQALANKQAAQASGGDADETGGETNRVRLFPMDKKIQALLIIPSPDPDNAGRDTGRVGSLIG